MHLLNLRFPSLIALTMLVASVTACTNTGDNPDQIRQRTAEATETMRRDAKAVAEGMKEGMSAGKTVNINKASREDLVSLPGITEREADRIIADRPFADAHDLVKRHVLTEAEYARISDRIIANR
jgi:DNA uptake protein ComE-like DNA-binding protein